MQIIEGDLAKLEADLGHSVCKDPTLAVDRQDLGLDTSVPNSCSLAFHMMLRADRTTFLTHIQALRRL